MTGAAVLAEPLRRAVAERRRRWLVTGAAGFIGSHLVETLLALGQEVTGLDNFATGSRDNLEEVQRAVGDEAWRRYRFVEGDIVDLATCRAVCAGTEAVLHQAALGSVPRSIENPIATHAANATGFVNVLSAAREAGVQRIVYASSSSVYGDDPGLPKVEDAVGRPLSPYAATKRIDELYAEAFARCYGMELIGLRYFNVFGARQEPEGPYAAVIPRWARSMLGGTPVTVFGDGESSRDFCFVANAVQANLRAALVERGDAIGQVYNLAVGERTTLNALYTTLRELLAQILGEVPDAARVREDFRPGDVRHSLADIGKARRLLGYEPTHDLRAGLRATLPWYVARFGAPQTAPGRALGHG